jgi:hypothetical protein
MNTSVSILFYIKRAKVNSNGVCPIYVRVTIDAKRFEFSANKSVSPDQWSGEGSKVRGGGKEARSINDKNKVLEAEKRLFKKDMEITSENLKNEILGSNDRKEC